MEAMGRKLHRRKLGSSLLDKPSLPYRNIINMKESYQLWFVYIHVHCTCIGPSCGTKYNFEGYWLVTSLSLSLSLSVCTDPPPLSSHQSGLPPLGHDDLGHQPIPGQPGPPSQMVPPQPTSVMQGGPQPPSTSTMLSGPPPPPGPGGQNFPQPPRPQMYSGPPTGPGPQYPPPPGGPMGSYPGGGAGMGPGPGGSAGMGPGPGGSAAMGPGPGGHVYTRSSGPPTPGMGPVQQQPRSRIDPDQMPNPVS